MHINCDMGEGFANEHLLMPYLSACNIACGGHVGDLHSMEQVAGLALQHQVAVGAHPSYPDAANFGRVSISIPEEALIHSISNQVAQLKSIVEKQGHSLTHIKAHGALYHDIAQDPKKAQQFLKAIAPYRTECQLYVPDRSVVAEEALKQGFSLVYEAFADRNYTDDLKLVSRTQAHALITEPERVLEHVLRMHRQQTVQTISGKLLPIQADTFCVHSDTDNAPTIVQHLHQAFSSHER